MGNPWSQRHQPLSLQKMLDLTLTIMHFSSIVSVDLFKPTSFKLHTPTLQHRLFLNITVLYIALSNFRNLLLRLLIFPHNIPPSQVEVSPLENAIEVIENKNLQLRTLITQCQSRQMQNINPLTMCLNGVIDAAVNGGLARYQEV